MKRKHIVVQLVLVTILVTAFSVSSYAAIYNGFTTKRPTGTIAATEDVITKYKVETGYTTGEFYRSFQNDGKSKDITATKLYYKQANHSNWETVDAVYADKGKWRPYQSYQVTNPQRGVYEFYYKYKNASGWHELPHQTLKVYVNRSHQSYYTPHTMLEFTNKAFTGALTESDNIIKSKVSKAYVNDSVYASIQNCGGCSTTTANIKTYKLYVQAPGQSDWTVYTSTAKEGSYNVAFSKKITLDKPGTYKLKHYQLAYSGASSSTAEGNERTIVVEKRPANLQFSTTAVTKEYGSGSFTVPVSKSSTAKVIYSSSDNNIASVDSAGNISINGIGTATIEAQTNENSVYKMGTASVKITVTKGHLVGSGTNVRTIYYGAAAKPVGSFPDVPLYYSSSNESILKVDDNGMVKAVGLGPAEITVSCDDNEYYLPSSCVIKYKASLTKPKLHVAAKKISRGKRTVTLSWSKVNGRTKYQLYRYNSSKKKYVLLGSTTSTIAVKKNCKKTERFKVRAYRTVDGKKVYGPFSGIIKVKFSK